MKAPRRKEPKGVLVITEMAHQHKTAAEYRLRAVESQLSAGFTLCAMAETAIRYGHRDEAIKVLTKVQYHAERMNFHIDEPNHLPSTATSRLREQVTQLKARTQELESRIR